MVPWELFDDQVRFALAPSGGEPLTDWGVVGKNIGDVTPSPRRAVRLVRVYSDQPVFFYKGFALLPDPTRPEAMGDPLKDWNVALDCLPDSPKRSRCISLHRDHAQNWDVGALAIVARTIILRGDNATGGLSLITFTENLVQSSGLLDLSARHDPAPSFGVGQSFALTTGLIGSPALPPVSIDDSAFLTQPSVPPSATNPWRFVSTNNDPGTGPLADLQWQFDQARSFASDYDWSAGDPCQEVLDKETCWKTREPRGFSGLGGGSWFGMTYRATALNVQSRGQPGGSGGKGLDAPQDIACGAPPVDYQKVCQTTGLPCAPGAINCDTRCICEESCNPTGCSVNYASADQSQDCVVTCGISPLAKGQRGGQAGPGGWAGIARIAVVTKIPLCYQAESFGDPYSQPRPTPERSSLAMVASCMLLVLRKASTPGSPGQMDPVGGCRLRPRSRCGDRMLERRARRRHR